MTAPDVSIIVPVYNAENLLSGMISSVLGQTLSAWELILVNDGSADRSEEIIRQYAEKDSRISSSVSPMQAPQPPEIAELPLHGQHGWPSSMRMMP